MTRIEKASIENVPALAKIGGISWAEGHAGSALPEDLQTLVTRRYSHEAVTEELKKPTNQYHLIYSDDRLAGYSNIIVNAADLNIAALNVAELDRLYLLKEFYDRKLGLQLLQFNIEIAKRNGQSGLWLYVWKGNERAVAFYTKAGFKIIGSHDFKVSDTHTNPNHQMFLAI